MSKQKGKKSKGRPNGDIHSDNESMNDMASICSYESNDTENNGIQDEAQITTIEKNEEKILQSIENATEKSAKVRIQALQSICEVLQHRYFPDFIDDRKLTILDIIEKSLRRGKDMEQETAAQLAILLILASNLGGGDEALKTLCHLLSTTMQNPASSIKVKVKSCTALSMFYFLVYNNSDDIDDIVRAMQQFEQIFAGSYSTAEKASTLTDGAAQLHVEALGGWGLLATLIPPGEFCSYINNNIILPSMKNFVGLLNSPHVEVRMACGEVIAVILERGRILDENLMDSYMSDLIQLTCQLSKDSQKYRGKRERKAQRASFRDVLRYLEEDISPEIQIRFGKETLDLSTWSMNIQYEKLCEVIGPGITTHLTENEFVRDILQLGPKLVLPNSVSVQKQSKLERHLINAAAFKARTLSLKKNRDKRSAVFH